MAVNGNSVNGNTVNIRVSSSKPSVLNLLNMLLMGMKIPNNYSILTIYFVNLTPYRPSSVAGFIWVPYRGFHTNDVNLQLFQDLQK